MSASYLEWFRAAWPVLVALCGFMGLFFMLWLKSRFVTKDELAGTSAKVDARIKDVECRADTLDDLVAAQDKRLSLLEEHINTSPSRQEIQSEISRLAERVSGMDASVKGIGQQLATQNQYLHTIIDRGLGQK